MRHEPCWAVGSPETEAESALFLARAMGYGAAKAVFARTLDQRIHMRPTVLLADDEDGIRKVVGLIIADLGYEVIQARDGIEALELFRARAPRIVVTDVRMPRMDGLELLKRIKAESPQTEVVIVTGHADVELAIEGLKHDAGDFIHKPIQPETLEIALQRAERKIALREELLRHTTDLERRVREQADRIVDMERQAAACQVADGLAQAVAGMFGGMGTGVPFLGEMPCYVAVHGPDGLVRAVNARYRDRLGDRVGQPSCGIYVGEAAQPGNCPVARTLATGQGVSSLHTVRCADGSEAHVSVHTAPIRGMGGRVDLVVEIAADMDEVRRLREELNAAQQRFQLLFDEAPCIIAVIDREMRIVAANRRFKEDVGGEQGELCHRALRRSETACKDCPVQKTFADGAAHSMETQVLSRHGRLMHMLIRTAPILGPDGKVAQVMELAADLTEMRHLQDHVTQLGMLMASLSHGIKGLLTALDGAVYKVDSGLQRNDRERLLGGWEQVRELLGRVKGMILDILYCAKKREPTLTSVDAAQFVQKVADVVAAKAETQGVAFECDFGEELGVFSLDQGALSAALVNLLENAVEACRADAGKKEHRVVFRVHRHGGRLELAISDNGVGMTPEVRDKLFQVFFSTKGSKGTGLGLFIARQTIEAHGGTIGVESEPGQGSTFTIYLVEGAAVGAWGKAAHQAKELDKAP